MLRSILTRLARRQRLSNDDGELLLQAIAKELTALPRETWVLDVLDEVVGADARRKRDSVHVLGMLSSIDGASDRLGKWLAHRDPEVRATVLGAIREHRWTALAPLLDDRLEHERDDGCRRVLLLACGALRSKINTRALLATAARDRKAPSLDRSPLLFALRLHGTPKAKPYFEAVFATEPPTPRPRFDSTNEQRVLAAWGLLALGAHPEARRFLIAMLDDPPTIHEWPGGRGRDPGVSQSAAQALCDVLGLPPKSSVVAIKAATARRAPRASPGAPRRAVRTRR